MARPRFRAGTLCVLCEPSRANAATDSHHLRPLEYGGAADGEQIGLCPTCHDRLHRMAVRAYNGDIELSAIRNPLWHRALSSIVEQRHWFDQHNEAPDARRRLSASLTKEEWQAAHFVKTARGFSSLEKMIKALILAEAAKARLGR